MTSRSLRPPTPDVITVPAPQDLSAQKPPDPLREAKPPGQDLPVQDRADVIAVKAITSLIKEVGSLDRTTPIALQSAGILVIISSMGLRALTLVVPGLTHDMFSSIDFGLGLASGVALVAVGAWSSGKAVRALTTGAEAVSEHFRALERKSLD